MAMAHAPSQNPSLPLDYYVVDVFTTSALAGNPLAVVIDTVGLETGRMQAIAHEFNLSETTFVVRRPAEVEQAEGVRVRIFTTREELRFAGHPTLGTASLLRKLAPETVRDHTVRLALNVGPIPVRFEAQAARSDSLYGEMTQRDPEFGAELDPSLLARFIGLSADDLETSVAPQVVSTGTAFAIVVLRSPEALAHMEVNHREATPYLEEHGARWFYVLAPLPRHSENGPKDFRARMQFYGGEDPATGSAAGCAISYLVGRGLVPSGAPVHLRQGIEIGRPSDIFVSAQGQGTAVTDVRVGGSTVLVAEGKLFLS
jgi:trans-2,3-dihydro-3-hydroxyanthranilate isomerase